MNKTRMGKRVASLLLSLVMMLSLLPTAAYAAMGDADETQGASVSENGTRVSDDSNSGGDTGDLQVGDSEDGGTADDTTGAEGGADTTGAEGGADSTDSVNGNDSADPQDNEGAVMPVASSVVSTSAELVAAIAAASDGDTITLGEGDFTTYGNTSPKKSLTFEGAGTETVWTIGDLSKDARSEGNGDCSFDGCGTITFRNMTLKSDGADYRGFIRISNTVVENCTLEGKTAYWGYETAKFEGSTFNAPEGDYALWDYSTKAMSFDNCKFNISGKGVNVYVEAGNAGEATRTVAVNNCTVNSTKENKAFLNIKNSTQAYDVTLSGTNTVTGLAADGTTGSALYQVEATKVTETTGKTVSVKEKADDGTVKTVYEVKETVAETTMDLDAFIKAVVASGYNYDGNGVTVKWSPATGCFDTRADHTCTAGNVKATGNTPNRVNAKYAQYQLFSGLTQNVTIKNVKFVYEATEFTVCANSGWAGSGTAANLAEFQFENEGDVKLLDCSFDGVAVAVYNDIETASTVVHGCSFTNITQDGGGYAIHYLKGGKIDVSENTFENVYRGMLVQSTVNKGTNIVNNNFSGIDANKSSCYMVKLLNVKDTDIVISGNTTAANAPVNVNVAYDGTDGAAIAVGDRISTIHTAETDGNGVAISTGGNQMTGYTAPSAAVEDASGITVDADGNVTVTLPAKTTSVAEVNGAKYDSLQAAVDAAKSGATVTLLADTRENVTVSKNAIVLDLNGHTLNGGTENAKPALTVDNKKVTLKDSSEAQTGTIKREDTADTKTSHYVIDIQGKNGFMIVESGKVENNSGIPGVKGSSLIRLGNDSVSGWPTLTIKGGTFTQDNFIAIKVDRGTLHLLGGTVNSANSFAIENWNNAYIKGGTVNGTVSTWVYSTGAAFSKLEISGGTVNGNVASVNYDNAADKQARVYVTGGTVTGTLGTYTYNNGLVAMDETAKATIEVTGGTFSKDPTQYVVEDSAISKNDDGTYGVAKTYLAKIGDTEYYTMDEAFHAVKAGETIVMLRDYTTNKVQNSGDESFTIDLGGHTWTANIVDTASAAFEINYSDVTLTVKNGKVVSSQLAGLIPSAMSGTITYDNSGLVFENVEMTANGHSGIETNGSNTNDTVTLKNSTLNVPNGYGIYFPSSGTLTIDNSKINAKTMGVQVCAGSLNISGAGTAITVSGDGIAKTENDGAIEDGAAISIVQRTGYKDLSKIEVEDGKFTANGTNAAVKAYKWESQTESAFDNSKNVVAVSGGTFSSAVDKSLCADGFIPTQNTDGTYGVKEGKYVAEVKGVKYETLQAAIDAAGRNATVTMLADTYENVTIATAMTLDLNGHTLNGGTVKGKPALTVTARVTVKDSSAAQTGTIKREDTAENSGVSSHYVIDIQDGWLFFESGNVTNNSGVVGVKGASLVRVGDDSIAKYPGLTISGGTFTQDNFIVIKVDRGTFYLKEDGTLNSKNSYAVENWKFAEIKGGTVNGTVAAWTYSGGHNSDLTISGGTVNGNVASVSYDKAEGKVAKVSITGGTVTGTLGTYTYGNGLIPIEDATKATIAVTGGTFKEDPSKYVVEDSAITPNDDGTYGVAKAYLAKVGDTSYYTMDEAFKAQTDSRKAIVMLRDYTTGSTFNSGSINRTVDLNGHTWTCTGTDANSAAFEINYPDASLTVKNGKVVSSQLVGLIPSAMGGTIKYDNSSLVFDGVEMTTTARSGIETNGNNTNDTVTLRNSTLNVPNGFGIYFPSSGTLTIDNSVINAKTMGVQVCSGSLNISGAGTAITVSGDGIPKTINDGAIEDGAAISIVNRTGYKGLSNIEVEGGKFTAKGDNAAVKAYNWENQTESAFDNSENVVAISGGTFSSAVDKSLCAEGFIPTQNTDGTYGVKEGKFVAEIGSQGYESLQAAIDAAQDGQTVTLLADATEDVVISKSITLDLGGKTLTNTNAGKATISVTGGTVTVKNGNVVGGTGYYNIEAKKDANLTLTDVTATAGNTGSSMIDNYGTLTITSGTYTGGLNVVKSEEGSVLNISGGTFTRKTAPKWGITGTVLVYGTTTITGGTFNEKSTSTNARVVVTGRVDGYDSITYVKGGTFNGNGNSVFHHLSPAQADDSFEVSGGTFNKSIPDYYCTDGFIPTKNADGTYGVKVGQYVAQIGSKKYETLADAIRLAAKGKTITLLCDVEQNAQLTINKNITLDLNGKTIKNTVDIWSDNANAILSITNGAKVTITGNGTIDAKENDCYTINVVKGDLTIENGTFYGNVSVVQVQEGTLSVKGGTFDLHQKWEGSSKYLFNCIDDAYVDGSAKVAISGGTFVGFDPNVSPEQKVDGKTPSFAAPGAGITKNEDGSFTAAAGMTAQILDKDGNSVTAYNTLAEAVAAAEDGQTVRLLADVTLNEQIATGKAITIDGQSQYTIKAAKKLVAADGKAGMFYRTQSAKGTMTFLNVTLDGGGVSKIFLNEGGAGETVFDGVTSTNGGGIAYGSGIHISGGGSHATIRNSTLTGSTGTMELNDTNYYAANDLWVGGNVYVTVENSVIGNVFVNSAPSATPTNSVVHGQLTITGENTKITYLSGEEEKTAVDKLGNNGSLVKIDSGCVDTVFDMGFYAISGGTFKTEVKKEWCVAGYVPADNGDGTYGVAVGKFTVKVTSRTTGSDSPVANVAGGGSDITYAAGTTVTASAISGYNFVGWFVNEYTGTAYSTALTCEVKPTDDWTMIAVYEPISGGKFWLTVTASEFTVNGGAVQDSYLYEQFAVGASVTVNFTGSENFLYWVNASNKVVSTDKSYTFIMGSETTLKAVYGKARQNQATVVFISHSDQIISSKAYTTNDTIQFPVPPIKMGCTFTGWSMTEEQIRAAMANNSGIIQVRALYTEPSIACKVTVVYPEGTDNQVVNAVVGKAIDVTAKDIEGKTFSYWTDNDGNILGYTKTLKLAPSGDMTVKAVYGENAEVKPVISMTAIDASAGNGYYVISVTATRAVPEGYELVKQGILYSLDSRCAGDAGKDYLKLTADGTVPEGVYEYSGTDQALNGVTRFNGKVGAADTTLYGRGYMILKNSAGEVLYVYADTILSGSYNSLNK